MSECTLMTHERVSLVSQLEAERIVGRVEGINSSA